MRTTWTTVAAGCAIVGGLAWLAKQGVIAASVGPDGAPPEGTLIGVFFLLGLGLMVVGATGVGAALLRGRPTWLRAGAALVLAPLIFLGIQTVTDASVDALVPTDAHWWWAGEGGIVLTALVFLAGGVWARRRARSSDDRETGRVVVRERAA
jgi:hypothetical protein